MSQDALTKLYARRRAGVRPGLAATRQALRAEGLWPAPWPVTVLVGGTNGKGSTSALLASILKESGIRTGVFSSPHLISFGERFRIGGLMAGQQELESAIGHVVDAHPNLTFFEASCVIAATLFQRAGVDVAILEVGLGGRLDATNCFDADASCVTGVALDHEAYLGSSLRGIAWEKAAIARAGRPCIVGLSGLGEGRAHVREFVTRSGAIAVEPQRWPHGCGLAGAHQEQNAGNAHAVALALKNHCGLAISETAIADGLDHAHIDGRLECIDGSWLDGAHNPAAATALANFVGGLPGPVRGVIGMSADKDHSGILAPMLKVLDECICVAADDPRAVPAAEIQAMVTQMGRTATVASSVAEGVMQAKQLRGAGSVVVFGSLFVVGEARAYLTGDG